MCALLVNGSDNKSITDTDSIPKSGSRIRIIDTEIDLMRRN